MIISTICARGGSEGVPRKNIRILLGKPLIAYSIEHAQKCELISRVIISTDSREIARIASEWGAEVPFIRPQELATNIASKLPVIQHAVKYLIDHESTRPEYVVDLDPTSPLRTVDDIRNCIKKIKELNCDVVITGNQAKKSPYFNMVEVKSRGQAELCKKSASSVARRQDSPKVYEMNSSIYVFKTKSLLEMSALWDVDVRFYEMPVERSIDIDREIDFKLVELIMNEKAHEL